MTQLHDDWRNHAHEAPFWLTVFEWRIYATSNSLLSSSPMLKPFSGEKKFQVSSKCGPAEGGGRSYQLIGSRPGFSRASHSPFRLGSRRASHRDPTGVSDHFWLVYMQHVCRQGATGPTYCQPPRPQTSWSVPFQTIFGQHICQHNADIKQIEIPWTANNPRRPAGGQMERRSYRKASCIKSGVT